MRAPLADRAPRRLRVRLALPRVSRPVVGRVSREPAPLAPCHAHHGWSHGSRLATSSLNVLCSNKEGEEGEMQS